MSKPPVGEGFRQKVKQFFGGKKGNAATSCMGWKTFGFVFHQELLQVNTIYLDRSDSRIPRHFLKALNPCYRGPWCRSETSLQ